jgi:hypothetical protein
MRLSGGHAARPHIVCHIGILREVPSLVRLDREWQPPFEVAVVNEAPPAGGQSAFPDDPGDVNRAD